LRRRVFLEEKRSDVLVSPIGEEDLRHPLQRFSSGDGFRFVISRPLLDLLWREMLS